MIKKRWPRAGQGMEMGSACLRDKLKKFDIKWL